MELTAQESRPFVEDSLRNAVRQADLYHLIQVTSQHTYCSYIHFTPYFLSYSVPSLSILLLSHCQLSQRNLTDHSIFIQ